MKTQTDRVVSLTLLAVLALPLPLAAQESSVPARAGELARVATVDLSKSAAQSVAQSAPLNAALAPAGAPRPRGARLLHLKNSASPSSGQFSRLLPASPSNPAEGSAPILMDVEHSGGILHNFDGVSSLDSAVTNFGAEFEPPDQGLCVGNGFVIEPVNSAFTIYRRNGSVVAGPFNVNALFDEGLLEFTSDPRCYFDAATNTWFAIILFISADSTEARTDIAVNTSGDPTTAWTVYHLEQTDDGTSGTPVHVGCPCFGDQPLLGIDGENIYISTNEFSILGPQANGAQIYAVSKRDLIRGTAHVHFVQFENLSIAGSQAFSVQPAITRPAGDGADAEFFLQSIDPGISDNRLGVWALTRQESVSEGGIPTLTNVVITSEDFGVPPNAVQKGSASLLNTGDDRMQQAQFIGGELWGALNTTFSFPGDPTQLSANAWFRIHPRIEGHRIAGAAIAHQGYVASAGNFLLYPAIQVSPEGGAAMVFTLSGPDFFPSAAYALLSEEGRSFGPIRVVAPGSGPYDPKATRWGDYSFAIADPSGNGIWMATEYMPPAARQTVDGRRNWGTRVFEVSTREE